MLLHDRLTVFFRSRKVPDPEEMASETLERVSQKLEAGVPLYTNNVVAYTFGVARNVLREARRNAYRHFSISLEQLDESELPVTLPVFQDKYVEANWEEVLRLLPTQDRHILVSYSVADYRQRKRLAVELGIGLESLRVRVARIRKKLGLPRLKSKK